MDGAVHYELVEGVAVITMDDGKANALSLAMLAGLNVALDRATADGAVVLITGRDGIFSGGFDLKVLAAGGSDAARMLEEGFLLALRVLEHPAPVVMACNGHAIAMGLFLLLAGDYRIGVEGPYRLVANEVAIGLTMPWSAVELCRQRLAPSHFNRAVLLSETYTPSAAVEAGMLDAVVDGQQLRATAAARTAQFALLDRSAHAGSKVRLRQSAADAVRSGLELDRETFRLLSGEAGPGPS